MDRWLADLGPLAGRDLPAAMQASILAATIAEWSGPQRRLAMAARRAPEPQWQAVQAAFWEQLAERIGLGPHAPTIACFAMGESARHLLDWTPAIDRALLDETVAALVLWLREGRLGGDAVRHEHRALARADYREPPALTGPVIATIADAAAALLAEQGHAGVTFRAVAARAGVTLGTVIHQCGSKSELLRRALHRLYEVEALGDRRAQFETQTVPPALMREQVLAAALGGDQPLLRAYDEIELAIYNGDEFAPLRGVVRSMEDPSGDWTLRQLMDGTVPPASLVAAFSAVVRGIGFHAQHEAARGSGLEQMARAAVSPFCHKV